MIIMLVYVVVVVADVALFMATPYEFRPRVWWLFWPASGFIVYAMYKRRQPQHGESK